MLRNWLILRDFCKMTPSKIFYLQCFMASGFLDVAFHTFSDCLACFDQCSRHPAEDVLRGLRLVPLFAMDEVLLTVHLYNPFVADEDIKAFLGRYCSSVSAGEKIRGQFGVWNRKRRLLVRLRVDPAVPGGLLHPQAVLPLGLRFLFYPGQPLYCRR